MKTGATRQQIEDAALQYHDRIGGRKVKRCKQCEIPARNWASYLVDENHRIVSVEDLKRLWEMANNGPRTMAEDFWMDTVVKPLIAGDGE